MTCIKKRSSRCNVSSLKIMAYIISIEISFVLFCSAAGDLLLLHSSSQDHAIASTKTGETCCRSHKFFFFLSPAIFHLRVQGNTRGKCERVKDSMFHLYADHVSVAHSFLTTNAMQISNTPGSGVSRETGTWINVGET